MFELPKSALVNRFIPKNTFYKKFNLASAIKEEFVDLIEKIVWLYKISEDTVGISKNKSIEEIQIFEISLKVKKVPDKSLKVIAKSIPYPILFKIKYNDEFCYAISLYNDNEEYERLYINEWNKDINIDFVALDLKKLYSKMIKEFLVEFSTEESIESIINKNELYNKLNNDIIKLSNQLKKEKQFNKKININKELNKKKQELEELKNG